jgi:hypothetical protein
MLEAFAGSTEQRKPFRAEKTVPAIGQSKHLESQQMQQPFAGQGFGSLFDNETMPNQNLDTLHP